MLKQNSVAYGVVSRPLTLQNVGCEIRCSVSAVQRYRIERLGGRQFACWVDAKARDADRDSLVNSLICVTRLGSKLHESWW